MVQRLETVLIRHFDRFFLSLCKERTEVGDLLEQFEQLKGNLTPAAFSLVQNSLSYKVDELGLICLFEHLNFHGIHSSKALLPDALKHCNVVGLPRSTARTGARAYGARQVNVLDSRTDELLEVVHHVDEERTSVWLLAKFIYERFLGHNFKLFSHWISYEVLYELTPESATHAQNDLSGDLTPQNELDALKPLKG